MSAFYAAERKKGALEMKVFRFGGAPPRVRESILSVDAEYDVIEVLEKSEYEFGNEAAQRYRTLLETSYRYVARNPNGIGTKPEPKCGVEVRSLHLRTVRDGVRPPNLRVKNPRHYLLYRPEPLRVLIGRVLHDRAVAELHITENTWRVAN